MLCLQAWYGWNQSALALAQVEATDERVTNLVESNRGEAGEAANFVVRSFAGGPASREVTSRCEQLRREWLAKWVDEQPCAQWQPPCEIVIHRHRGSFQQSVGRAGASALGSSLVRRDGEQPIVRRIDLLATSENELPALAHELVHIMLADIFKDGFPPLWVDEGLAMLVDTAAKQRLHWRDCHHALNSGTALPLRDLLHLDRPPAPHQFPAVYGQSLSLARFFAHRGRPEQMLAFVHRARHAGYLEALRDTYGLDGFEELEVAWRRFVRAESEGSRLSLR